MCHKTGTPKSDSGRHCPLLQLFPPGTSSAEAEDFLFSAAFPKALGELRSGQML